MRVLGIVTARGGSKSIPNKNLTPLAGRPLLAYTAEAALSARKLDRVVLSTDDEAIADAGRSLGLEVPFMRPEELAKDDTPTIPVLQDVVRKLEAQNDIFDAVFTLQPTNPLRTADDINGAISLLESSGADSVISFVDVGAKHPARMKYIDEKGQVIDPPFAEEFEGQPRQSLPKLYLRDGSVYVTRKDVLMVEGSLQGRTCLAWLIPPRRSVNIDETFDLLLAEFVMRAERTHL